MLSFILFNTLLEMTKKLSSISMSSPTFICSLWLFVFYFTLFLWTSYEQLYKWKVSMNKCQILTKLSDLEQFYSHQTGCFSIVKRQFFHWKLSKSISFIWFSNNTSRYYLLAKIKASSKPKINETLCWENFSNNMVKKLNKMKNDIKLMSFEIFWLSLKNDVFDSELARKSILETKFSIWTFKYWCSEN